MFLPIFVVDTKMISGYNFVAPLKKEEKKLWKQISRHISEKFRVTINFSVYIQGIIQKKSVSRSRMLPSLMIFYWNFILIWKCQKWSLNRGTVVLATTIYQTKCPFTVLSALFLFFWMLPYDSRLFPDILLWWRRKI